MSVDPDYLLLTSNGWISRAENYGSEVRWWNYNITSMEEPETWISKEEAIKLQLKILAGTRRW